MAPPRNYKTINKRKKQASAITTIQALVTKYVNFEYLKYLIFDPSALPIVALFIIVAEFFINVLVIWHVPYTEIDWIAYMQECEGFLNGTLNYELLRGDTGPLVYPAAFLYIYTGLFYITSHGTNIRLTQYIFASIYLVQLWLVLRLYAKTRKVPPYVLVLSAFTSYRIHSIYILRLFNDPIAILFLYGALNLFMDRHWSLGSICFSIGVGVKMNILLFAPALLLFYIANLGIYKTLLQLALCGLVQLVIGLPFLLSYPHQYIKGSFDLGRIFEHKWTVNYRFLPNWFFISKYFHLSLLVLHLMLLLVFSKPIWTFFKSYVRLRELQNQLEPQLLAKNRENTNIKKKLQNAKQEEEQPLTKEQQTFLKAFEKGLKKSTALKESTSTYVPSKPNFEHPDSPNVQYGIHFDQCTQLALLPFFIVNLIGLACARSLHYQFYVWYFHSLPYLVWSTPYTKGMNYLLLGLIEYCWNTYPSTIVSSLLLHFCHIILLLGVGQLMYETTKLNEKTLTKME